MFYSPVQFFEILNFSNHHKLNIYKKISRVFMYMLKAPSNSPELNPIEMIFADMKHFISSKMCSTLDEVRHAIALYKQDLTIDKIASFK
jgi:transposase